MNVDAKYWPRLIEIALSRRDVFLSNRRRLESGCIEWTGYRDKDGYGKFHAGGITIERGSRARPGKRIAWVVQAHRFAMAIDGVDVPDDLVVRHQCDNPPCVNPEHLLVGTDKENKADALSRGRACVGQRHPFARLTDEIVREIIRRRSSGERHASIAASLGVSTASVSTVGRVSWRHIREAA